MTAPIAIEDIRRTAHMPAAAAASSLGVNPESLRRARRRIKTPRELTFARALLEGGASYPEVSRTVGMAVNTLRRALPGYEVSVEHRALMAAILAQPATRRLHEEFSRR